MLRWPRIRERRSAGATNFGRFHFCEGTDGFIRWHSAHYRAAFVTGEIGLVAALHDDKAAAAVHFLNVLVRNDGIRLSFDPHSSIIAPRRTKTSIVIE
jgi:hypothetical protein